MKTTVIVAVSDNDGLNAGLAEHFGRASFYAVAALDKEEKLKMSRRWKRGRARLFRTISVYECAYLLNKTRFEHAMG